MKMQRLIALAVLPVATASMAVASAGTASAAPNENANCVAQLTTNPEFGPPGPERVGGAVVSQVALGDRSDCIGVLGGILGGP
jgi:hypothetical protein